MAKKKAKPDPRPASSSDARREAAETLRRFLAAVEAGELDANSAHAKALLRRLEGAVIGLEADDGERLDDSER